MLLNTKLYQQAREEQMTLIKAVQMITGGLLIGLIAAAAIFVPMAMVPVDVEQPALFDVCAMEIGINGEGALPEGCD